VPPKLVALLTAVAVVVPIDRWTKLWVIENIPFGELRPVIGDFFAISHAVNEGIIFGLLWGGGAAVFAVGTLVAMGFILQFYRQLSARDWLPATALGLILGGAVGNLIDRMVWRGVVDFLHFDFGWFIYPDFNVADSAIVVGVGILLVLGLLEKDAAPGPVQQVTSTPD
jgi:signal peptidase II